MGSLNLDFENLVGRFLNSKVMPRLTLQDLLNPAPSNAQICLPLSNPPLTNRDHAPLPSHPLPAHLVTNGIVIEEKYRLNRKTLLSKVYQYPTSATVEYPETGATPDDAIGHLFEMSCDAWYNPALDFAYSRGVPSGVDGKTIVPLLVSRRTGLPVPCMSRHSTCM
ncbi:hypothetical protein PM082_023228 [Marasmius tenuissimus]|nr:hypothetical protein PM082_023228 [Marasmius tenuissimus]